MADTPSPTRIATLQSRLDQLQRDIAAERARASRATIMTLIAGVVFLGLLGFYFYYGYTNLKSVAEPKMLVDYGEQMVNDNLPKARESLEEHIKKSAPEFASQLSKQAQDATPKIRQKVTEKLLEEMEKMAQEAVVMSEQHFKAYLHDNEKLINQKFEELKNNPKLAEASLRELTVPLENEFGGDMKIDAVGLSRDLAAITANLKYLGDPKNEKYLTEDQRVEKRFWMIVHALQLRYVPEAAKESPLLQEK